MLAYRTAHPPRALRGERIVLEPLTPRGRRAAAGRAPASRRDELYERSGGNPLYLEALP